MSSNNRIYDAQFSALAKSIASSFRTQLPPNTISNIVDLESLKSTLTTAIPASVPADLMAQSLEWAKYLSDLSSPVSFESVKNIASAASQLVANYDFSQITKAYSPAGDNNEPAPDEEVDVPPEVYELVDSITEMTTAPDVKSTVFPGDTEIADAIEHRPKKLKLSTLRAIISLIGTFLSIVIPIVQGHVQGKEQTIQNQQIISLQEQDLESDHHVEELLECNNKLLERNNELLEYICLHGIPVSDGSSPPGDSFGELGDVAAQSADTDVQMPDAEPQTGNDNGAQDPAEDNSPIDP